MESKVDYLSLLRLARVVMDDFEDSCADGELNRTEVEMLSIVRMARMEGKKMISTQIAAKLNVTRSAVSQTVDRMEERGYLCRVPSDTDKKIAYIVLSDEQKKRADADLRRCYSRLRKALDGMGEEDSARFLSLLKSFRSKFEEADGTEK